jgi:hypothetical protein
VEASGYGCRHNNEYCRVKVNKAAQHRFAVDEQRAGGAARG